MKYKGITIGLVSLSALLSACTSVQNSPGYRANVGEGGFVRSGSVKEVDNRMLGRPTAHPVQPAWMNNNMRAAVPPKSAYQRTAYNPQPQQKDVELILGKRNYYRENVQTPKVHTGRPRGGEAGIALNFERASIREVVKVVLGDILQQTYTVEPGVEGEVTISSSDPIPRKNLLPTLESLLQTQGAVLYQDGSGYRIAARSNMKGRGLRPSTGKLKPGYSMQVVPLRYIPAAEMQKILEPLANPDAFVRVDSNRNLLVLAGTSSELANLLATVRTFDVDVLQGMSVGLFKVKNVEAAVVAKNMEALFGEGGNSPMAGMVKIIPIEHMNTLMIISASPDYLRDMKKWVDRFDQTSPVAGRQLYVYRVKNGNAEHLAEMLTQIFTGSGSSKKRKTPRSSLAPGLQAGSVGEGAKPAAPNAATATAGLTIEPSEDTKIVADKTNNSLMIMSTEATYQQILEALKRIDVMPMQVQVEASILEVSLTDNLQYGLQWAFKNHLGNKTGTTSFDTDNKAGLALPAQGFSYSLTDPSGTVRATLSALASQSKLKVISSPSVLVLDNQTAEIRVGNQQPVFTGSSTTDGGVVTQNVQFKDTGVSLNVTPQVNTNGLVKMEIQQEVTDVGEIDQATNQRSFLQRNIKSSIAVKSGETIVLGGLIRENKTDGKTNVPVLGDVPIVGKLFTNKSQQGLRTELLVLITPTVIKTPKDLVKAGEEMRSRMKGLFDDKNDSFLRQLRGGYDR